MSLFDRAPFPLVWDNTMLADSSDCEQKVNIRFFHHIVPAQNNVNLHAGGAFAKGIEVTRRAFYASEAGKDKFDAPLRGVEALIKEYGDFDPGDSTKSADRMIGALESYLTTYNPETDHLKPLIVAGQPLVEFSFAHPIDVMHPETGEPLIYAGRFDMLGVLNGDEKALFVVDEKTTKQLGPTWPKQWGLRSQFMGYTWGAQKDGYPVVGAVVRGISILKASYGHAEAIVYFEPWKVERWYDQACHKLRRLIEAWKNNKFTYNFSTICSSYGGCPYQMLCESPRPDDWLDPYYTTRKWDPIKVKGGEE